MGAIQGKNKILAFRLLKDAATATGTKLALQVEHTLNYERSNETTETKDGPVVSPGALVPTLELSALATDDPLNKMLMKSVIDGEKLEIWEIDLTKEVASGKYNALYMQGNLRSWSVPAPATGPVTISTAADIDGVPKEGQVTLTAEQISEVQYAFKDLANAPG